MKNGFVFLLVTMLAFAQVAPLTTTLASFAPTPHGGTTIVTNPADSGPGTLRQALLDAQEGDTITFDPTVCSRPAFQPPSLSTPAYLKSARRA